jgi:hypothetical protein
MSGTDVIMLLSLIMDLLSVCIAVATLFYIIGKDSGTKGNKKR